MISKWFKQKSVPKNNGKSDTSKLEKPHYIKVFELELSNMEDSPVYELKHQLSIGSEIGNIVIADASVSPRHASFILQDEVVSVIDHGSVAGTLVNGKKIAAGKYIILEETDVVACGDLEVKLQIRTESAPAEVIPDIPEISEELPDDEDEIEEHLPQKKFDAREHLKSNSVHKKNQKKVPAKSIYSANALMRVFAVLSDLMLSYSLLIILMPFDEFRSFMDFVPSALGDLLGIEWGAFWSLIMEDYQFLAEMLNDAYQFFSSTFHFVPIFLMFVVTRLVSTLAFGVSVSEFMLGIRPTGNGSWARVGGVLRVLLGVFTGPFLIFDVPAIVSRRTLKEFMTFTCIALPSKFLAVLGIIVYIPALAVLVLIAPLMQGLEPPEPIIVSDKIEQRIKVKGTDENMIDSVAAVKKEQSKILHLEIAYDSKELTLIPEFKFRGIKNKLNLKSGLVFYQKDLQRSVELEVLKNFDFKQLIGVGLRGNVLLYEKYPILYSYVYSNADTNPNFKPQQDEKSQIAFANEFIRFTKMAFSLSLENALDIMQEETFLIKGLVDYKSSFLGLLEYKDFNQISFIKIGNAIFMKVSYSLQKPFDLLIPVVKGDGQVFKVSWDKNENLNVVSSKFYKFNLEKTNWISEQPLSPLETMNALEVLDLFSSDNFKVKLLSPEVAQRLYGYYFEATREVLKASDPLEIEVWKSKIKALPKLIETIPIQSIEEGVGDTRSKLLQNFSDLIDALENNHKEYFGISETTTI